MKLNYLNPIPVFHYGAEKRILEKYIIEGNKYICLGNTVHNFKGKKNKLARWINNLIYQYNNVNFHLLGSTSKKLIRGCPQLYSLDSSTWITRAFNGKPNYINTKTGRAKQNIKDTIQQNEKPKFREYSQPKLFESQVI